MSKKSKMQTDGRQQPSILTRKRKADATMEGDIEENCLKRINSEIFNVESINGGQRGQDHGGQTLSSSDANQSHSLDSLLTSTRRRFQQLTCLSSSSISRLCPLPAVNWANSPDVWEAMIEKDDYYHKLKDHEYCIKHSGLQPRMRAIVMDWLIEVCEVYRLQRETYYLAMDYYDQFLTKQENVAKPHLQLIGITCLFIASKFEEIYPPKLSEFAYVTDGACVEEDIVTQEIILIKVLGWDLTPTTVVSWLNTYVQLMDTDDVSSGHLNLVVPRFSGHFFHQVVQILDLCMMDVKCLLFPNRIIAAVALYYFTSLETFRSVTALKWEDIHKCVDWMAPFVMIRKEVGFAEMKFFQEVNPEDVHNIQVHLFEVELLCTGKLLLVSQLMSVLQPDLNRFNITISDKALAKQNEILTSLCNSPILHPGILTPPNSNEKSSFIKQ